MDVWWMDGQMSGCLYWDVTVGLYKGRLLLLTIRAQEGLPQQQLGQETALRYVKKTRIKWEG